MDLEKIGEYLKRVYFAIDGLWFVKVEEVLGFEQALEIDSQVWEILPKIQARKAIELLDLKKKGLSSLMKGLELKWEAEGFHYHYQTAPPEINVTITHCPWYEIMIQSERKHLAAQVGKAICTQEYKIWADELGEKIEFQLIRQKCQEGDYCHFRFFQQ